MTEFNLSQSDIDSIVCLGSGASLAKTAKKDNWIEHADGELPRYVREVARSIHKKGGKTLSQAIAIAISRMRKWAATGEADTKAKAVKALAEWEALKAKNKSKKVAKLSRTGQWEMLIRPVEIIALSGPSYSIDNIRRAYDDMMREQRRAARASSPYGYEDIPWFWVKEVWNTHLIVENSDGGSQQLFKVDYTVDSAGNPTFKEPVEVVIEYVEAGKDISDDELASVS